MRTGAPMIDFNPHSKTLQDDPYATYRAMRDEAPVMHVPGLGFWAVSRYADVQTALREPETFSSRRSLDSDDGLSNVPMIVIMDPPRHGELRSLLSRAFTPRRVDEFAKRIREISIELIEQFIEAGSCDLWRDFSAPLPTIVIAELLGVPPEDREMFKEKSTALVKMVGPGMDMDPAALESSSNPVMELAGYLASIFDEKRKNPTDDLMGALLAAEVNGKRLDQAELVGFAVLLLIAGNETTTNLISNAAVLLDQHPDQRAYMFEDPARIETAVDEFLRFESPVQGLERIVTQELTLGGEKLKRGDKVFLMVGAANRDERVIENPDEFNIRRTPNPHLAFGWGGHFCLGANLARMETRIAFEEIAKRLPEYHVSAPTERLYSGAFRGLLSVPIEFKS
ncbi:MAG TPA: cytochrome P450 [Myxococcales bacterium]|nr:cytochrome P450 [Myxococcales bacterium]HIM01556.1 cytochrome P450 [Myxococcales bacterium]